MKKSDRQKVYNKYGGKCYLCGCELDDKWQVDHMISQNQAVAYLPIDEQDKVWHIDNLMPACQSCNHYKRAMCIDSHKAYKGFREYMKTFHIRFARYPKTPTYSHTIKRKAYMQLIANNYGITPETPFDGLFYFEKQNLKTSTK